MAGQNPTSWDIAAAAGVSQATVSRALRDSPLVREETRERVQQIARELNYSVNRSAVSLRTRHTRIIGLFLFDENGRRQFEPNPFFLTMLGSITLSAADLGYDVLVNFQGSDDEWLNDVVHPGRMDGVILLGYGDYLKSEPKLRALTEAGIQFILWGPKIPELRGHTIGCDNVKGGELAAHHLLECGRKRIAFLGNTSKGSPELAARNQGFKNALTRAGVAIDPELCIETDYDETKVTEAVRRLLASGKSFDAIFAVTDIAAIAAMRALQSAGIKVPEQVAIVGFDDLPIAEYVTPRLTTVRQDVREAGHLLVHSLMGMINGEAVASVVMEPQLVVRESSVG